MGGLFFDIHTLFFYYIFLRRDLCCCLTSDEYIDQPLHESPYGFDLSGGILTPAQVLLSKMKVLKNFFRSC